MIYCILGQTASGKTSLAISLARKFHVPVISADAFQCFKIMQIGTDKPKKEEIEGLDFYFTDEYEPDHEMSVYLFQRECRPIIERYLKEGKDIIVVGGNFLYVKALLFNYVFEDESSKEKSPYFDMPLKELQALLYQRDKDTYNQIDHNNSRRLVRALDQLDSGRRREDILKENDGKPIYPVEFVQLQIDKDEGNKKIDDRIDKMFEEGFVDEVKKLLSRYPKSLRPFHCIGYDEVIDGLEQNVFDETKVKDLIKTHTHQYAKKQRTFLRNQFTDIKVGKKEEIFDYLSEKLSKMESK